MLEGIIKASNFPFRKTINDYDFSFVGNQYKITVENKNFYVDLLFYHVKLKCYIAVE